MAAGCRNWPLGEEGGWGGLHPGGTKRVAGANSEGGAVFCEREYIAFSQQIWLMWMGDSSGKYCLCLCICLSGCLSGRSECHIIDPWVIRLSKTFTNPYFCLSLFFVGMG